MALELAGDRWKTNSFQELRIDEMNDTMVQYRTEVNKLAKYANAPPPDRLAAEMSLS